MILGATGATHDVLLAVDPEDVTAGGVGFAVIAGLAVGTALLLRSLNKQLKKVDFDEGPGPGGRAPGPETDGPTAGEPDAPEPDGAEPGGEPDPATDAATDRAEDEPVRNGPAADEPDEGPRSPAS